MKGDSQFESVWLPFKNNWNQLNVSYLKYENVLLICVNLSKTFTIQILQKFHIFLSTRRFIRRYWLSFDYNYSNTYTFEVFLSGYAISLDDFCCQTIVNTLRIWISIDSGSSSCHNFNLINSDNQVKSTIEEDGVVRSYSRRN